MDAWTGVAIALRSANDDAMHSRLPTYQHPLAGRELAWHVLRALADIEPPPRQLILATAATLDPAIVGDLDAVTVQVPADDWWPPIAERIGPDGGAVLLVDAAAAALDPSLATLMAGPSGRALRSPDGAVLGVLLNGRDAVNDTPASGSLDALAASVPDALTPDRSEGFLVHDRGSLARAAAVIRDRLVAGLMDRGVTFLLPETVLLDVDVIVEPDTIIYPGVVLEGHTRIGAETVIGPHCRIIDSWIGSGVELKGWNYISHSSVRNRAVVEPYVRRGFD